MFGVERALSPHALHLSSRTENELRLVFKVNKDVPTFFQQNNFLEVVLCQDLLRQNPVDLFLKNLINAKPLVLYFIKQFVRHNAQVLRNREACFQYKTCVKHAVVNNTAIPMR